MTPTAPRFAVVQVAVQDMAAALAFYRRLGLEVPDGSEDRPHVEALLPGGLKVAFDTVETLRTFDPGWTEPQGSRSVSLAFECASPAGVDAAYRSLTAAGYPGRKQPWDAFWGMRYAVVEDPDGNAVDLFALLPPDAMEDVEESLERRSAGEHGVGTGSAPGSVTA
ncbi:VOC family protein [Streptomyces sp. JJ36]|nr:VOC family protein [Streptomyces sp. JJ36]